MKNGWTYEHVGNNNLYVVIGIGKLKNKQTRKWEPVVLYIEAKKAVEDQQIYVREESDFKKRFTQVYPPVHTPERPEAGTGGTPG